jgi:hypothetical protein
MVKCGEFEIQTGFETVAPDVIQENENTILFLLFLLLAYG